MNNQPKIDGVEPEAEGDGSKIDMANKLDVNVIDFDVIVIGNGMIGSAAARYLSATDATVAAIGPTEPSNWREHNGVFASHYDQGRITRILDPSPVWGTLAERSIDAYAEIEEKSGIKFHHAAGMLRVTADPTRPGDTLDQVAAWGQEKQVDFERVSHNAMGKKFPFFDFPKSAVGLWERGQAGYVHPRFLVQAQLSIAQQQGATVVPETVVSISRDANAQGGGAYLVQTDGGQLFRAAKVLATAGAFTDKVMERSLDLRPKFRTILLAELSEAEANRLNTMPSIIYMVPTQDVLAGVYAIPPVRYPDGKQYIKIGGQMFGAPETRDIAKIIEWFHTDGHAGEGAALKEVLCTLIPSMDALSFQTKPCVVTYTAHDNVYIDKVHIDEVDSGLYVAAGGGGAAAKSSNEIGRAAALLVEHESWKYDIPAEEFAVTYTE